MAKASPKRGKVRRATYTGAQERLEHLWTLRLLAEAPLTGGFASDEMEVLSTLTMTLKRLGPSFGRPLRDLGALRTRAAKEAERISEETASPTAAEETIRALAGIAGLDAAESEILLFASVARMSAALMSLSHLLPFDDERDMHRLLSIALHLDSGTVASALRSEGPLRAGGLLQISDDVRGFARALAPSACVSEILDLGLRSPERIASYLAPESPPAQVTLEAFPHLKEDVALLSRFLRRALDDKARGISVLLHGESGTGKTELARALAAHVGARLYAVRFESEQGEPLRGEERLLAYRTLQHLAGRSERTMVLFDEVEDVFPAERTFFLASPGAGSAKTKAFTNHVLETSRAPTFWACNEIAQIDPAVLRRFDYVLELRPPPRALRRQMLGVQCGPLGVRDAWLDRAASREGLTPAAIERSARFVKGLGLEDAAEVERALDRVLDRGVRTMQPTDPDVLAYDTRWLRASVDPEVLIAGVRRTGRATMLFHGAPGTGKSALARHLARALDKPVIERGASDLLSKWVGDTEKALASVFHEAEEEGAVLVLDEVDSFLRPREGAMRSWEVTQVNELLLRIERFRGILVCTTNFLDGLDPAVLRRFDAKVKFEPPDAEARWQLFNAGLDALGLPRPSEGDASLRARVERLPPIAPGHVAAAVKSVRLTLPEPTVDALLVQLEAEQRIEGVSKRVTGF